MHEHLAHAAKIIATRSTNMTCSARSFSSANNSVSVECQLAWRRATRPAAGDYHNRHALAQNFRLKRKMSRSCIYCMDWFTMRSARTSNDQCAFHVQAPAKAQSERVAARLPCLLYHRASNSARVMELRARLGAERRSILFHQLQRVLMKQIAYQLPERCRHCLRSGFEPCSSTTAHNAINVSREMIKHNHLAIQTHVHVWKFAVVFGGVEKT